MFCRSLGIFFTDARLTTNLKGSILLPSDQNTQNLSQAQMAEHIVTLGLTAW